MPGFELIGNEEKQALINLFDKDLNNSILFDHAFHIQRNGHYEVREFEEEIAKKLNVKYAICCTSGTSALKIALKSLKIKCRDEVITQAFNFIAAPEAIYDCGAIVRLTNIDDTLNMDPDDLERKITSKTKAIIVVHMLGFSSNMNKIIEIGRKYNIPIIEDAAESLGGKYNNNYLGTIGDIGCYSLDFAKTITTGEGGIIVTNNIKYYKYIKEYIDHGHENNPNFPRGLDTVSIPGFNYRITEMQGAIGKVQLKKLDYIVEENTKRYKILENNLTFIKIRKNIVKDDITLHDTFIFEIKDPELNKLILDYCSKNIGIKNIPNALNWHFASFWGHIIQEDEINYINYSLDIIKKYIAIPILLKKTEDDYLNISLNIKEIYNNYYKNKFLKDGVVHLHNYFNDFNYLDNINENIYRYIEKYKEKLKPCDYNINKEGLITDAHCLHKFKDDFFCKLINNKDILNLCKNLLETDVEVFGCEVFFKRPGKNNIHIIPWHQDNSMWCLDDHNALTVWIAISDVNIENGSVRHLIKSFNLGLLEHEYSGIIGTSQKLTDENIKKYCNDFIQYIMEKGDITIHHSLSIHSSLPNNSKDKNRFAITLKIKGKNSKVDKIRFDKYLNDLKKNYNKNINPSIGLITKKFDSEYLYLNINDPWDQYTNIVYIKEIIIILLKFISMEKIHIITEMGCGFGCLLKYINNIFPNIKLIGYDNSKTCIDKNNNNNNNNNISFYVKNFNEFDYISNEKTDIIILSDITWYILDDLDTFIKNIKNNFKGKYFIHILTIYPQGCQKHGCVFFKTHDDILKYFDMNIINSGVLNDKSYFLAKIE